jgi:SAM-dependent methyltransferase
LFDKNDRVKEIVGYDISESMIIRAKSKSRSSKTIFTTRFPDGKFDLAVSLFHVPNQIINLIDLLTYFDNMLSAVRSGGHIVFDFINLTFLIDRPSEHYQWTTTILDEGSKIKTTCFNPETLEHLSSVDIFDGKEKIYAGTMLKQTIWPINIYLDILEEYGFSVIIKRNSFSELIYDARDYKTVLIAKKTD